MLNFSENNGFEDILQRMLDKIPDTLDKRQGSIIYDALAPAAAELAQAYISLDVYADQTYLISAVGENLDNKAYDYGISRHNATPAKRIGLFKNVENQDMEIEIGSRWSIPVENGGYNYEVTEQITIGKYVLTCETIGTAGNEYIGTLLPLEDINDLGDAKLDEIYIAGEDAESDDSLRERIIEKLNSTTFGGNIADYKQFVKSIDGIGNCLVIPVWNGAGTVKLLIVTTNYEIPTDAKINEVQTLVDPTQNAGKGYGKAPIGHIVTVTAPTRYELNIAFTITLDDGYTIAGTQQNIQNAINDYIQQVQKNWFTENSVTVYISRVLAAILSVEGVIDAKNLTINTDTADITIIPNDTTNNYPVLGEVNINAS